MPFSPVTGHPREFIELALAHMISNKVEAAYFRGDLFAKRRSLIDHWQIACDTIRTPASRGAQKGETQA